MTHWVLTMLASDTCIHHVTVIWFVSASNSCVCVGKMFEFARIVSLLSAANAVKFSAVNIDATISAESSTLTNLVSFFIRILLVLRYYGSAAAQKAQTITSKFYHIYLHTAIQNYP